MGIKQTCQSCVFSGAEIIGREVLSKSAHQERFRSILHSKASQKVAANIAKGLCKEVVDAGGIATNGSPERRTGFCADNVDACVNKIPRHAVHVVRSGLLYFFVLPFSRRQQKATCVYVCVSNICAEINA